MSTSTATLERDASASSEAGPGSILITVSCPDRIGVVADVSRFLVEHECNILQSAQYGDQRNDRFFLRTSFEAPKGTSLAKLEADFAPIA